MLAFDIEDAVPFSRKLVSFPLLFLVFLPACHRAPQGGEKAAAAQPSEPVFGWVSIYDRQVGMTFGGAVWWELGETGKVRFTIRSKAPISFGIVPRRVEKKEAPSIDFLPLDCAETDVTEAERECEVPNADSTLFTRDAQKSDAGAIHRSHVMNVKIEVWSCTNCPQKPKPGPER